jgi:DNA-binding transcriptional MerR regulator
MAMRIGQLAREAGVSASALRYYEAEGLLGPAARSDAGYRLYDRTALGRVEFIQRAKRLGLPLGEIRRLVDSPGTDAASGRAALRHLVAHKLADTRARIDQLRALGSELEALHTRLQRAPGLECGHVGDCSCWLPTEEEVKMMRNEIKGTETCTCCEPGTCCAPEGCSCGCPCCSD